MIQFFVYVVDVAKYVEQQSELFVRKYGYSSIGAVVGAKNILPFFNDEGLDAIINLSR